MHFPFLGFGLGLRPKHYPYILKHWPKLDFFEAISENYMIPGGRPLHVLEQVRSRYPLLLHGVSQNLGSTDPLDKKYLKQLKDLIGRFDPVWTSDHLCWTGTGEHSLHDLLPLPYTDEAVRHVAGRIGQVQDYLGRRILIENVSSYIEFTASSMTEWEFLSAIAEEADCGLLLDINNIYVSSVNHDFDPIDYLKGVPAHRIGQLHLAGHANKKKYLLDTHDHPVKEDVWKLYAEALKLFGPISTMIERDDRIPSFSTLNRELDTARQIYAEVLGQEKSPQPQENTTDLMEAHHGA